MPMTSGERLTMEPKAKSQIGRLVHDIDRHARRARGGGKARGFFVGIEGADGDGGARKIAIRIRSGDGS